MTEDAGGWDGAGRWAEGLERLPNRIRQRLVADQLAEVAAAIATGKDSPEISALDVGCGQGTQALALARAGHTVCGLDLSEELLGRFAAELTSDSAEVRSRVSLVHGAGDAAPRLTPGPFDLVMCHGVLMYLPDPAAMLGVLSQVAAPTGRLSLLVRNGLALGMRNGLKGLWRDALAAFDSPEYVNRLGLPARAHTPDELDALLAPLAWRRERWFGVRIFADALDPSLVMEGGEFDELLALETAAARRDPYRSVAALLHLVYVRG